MHRIVRVSAEDALRPALPRIFQRARRDFVREAQPARVQPVKEADKSLVLVIHLLQVEIDELAQPAQQQVVDHKAVKLMTMDGQMTDALILPDILPVYRDPDQVRHEVRQPMVVIALNPHHFNLAPGIRKLADT